MRHMDHLTNSGVKTRTNRYFLSPASCLFISKMNLKKNITEYVNIEQIKL